MLAAWAVACVFGLAACGSTVSGHPSAANSVVKAGSTTPHAPPTAGGDVDIQVEIGQCVKLGGSTSAATIDKAACGSAESNFKVVGKAPNSDGCPSDADEIYYETLRGRETGALCLDRDWVVGGCMDLGGEVVKRIDCAAKATEGVRVLSILPNTDAVDACPGSDGGYVYDQRRFVVCVQDL
nr:hypothetical protein [Nocardia transvalensis]